MSLNHRDYPPMPGGVNWPNVTAPASCFADTIEECDALRRQEAAMNATHTPTSAVNRLIKATGAVADQIGRCVGLDAGDLRELCDAHEAALRERHAHDELVAALRDECQFHAVAAALADGYEQMTKNELVELVAKLKLHSASQHKATRAALAKAGV